MQNFILTPSSLDERESLKRMFTYTHLQETPGDKGYISKDLLERLFIDGVGLISNHIEIKQEKCTNAFAR